MNGDALLQRAIDILKKVDPTGRLPHSDARDALIEQSLRFAEMYDDDRERLDALTTEALRRRTGKGPAGPSRERGGTAPSRSSSGFSPASTHRATGRPGAAPIRPAPSAAELTAPYRFVAIPDRIVKAQIETKFASLGFPIPNGFCGEIEVEWTFETPMLIGVEDEKGVAGPLRLGEDYVIPGATLRGMMRAAMSIVTRARLAQVNANHRYGVRDFTHPLFKESAGTQRLAWGNVRAGWLRKCELGKTKKEKDRRVTSDRDEDPRETTNEDEDARDATKSDLELSDYVLTPCDKAMVRIRALPRQFNQGGPTDSGEWHQAWLKKKLAERYETARYIQEKRDKRAIFDFEKRSKPTPFAPDPTATDHVIPGGGGAGSGWFVFSNYSPSLKNVDAAVLDAQQASPRPGDQKKREYVFFDRSGANEIRLTRRDFENFERINSKPSKTKSVPDGSYAVLSPTLEHGNRIPVFYVGDPGCDDPDFAMGLTRLFKLPHKYSVGDVLLRQKEHKIKPSDPDMVEALFGHVYDRKDLGISEEDAERLPPGSVARKGRLAFGFARLSSATPAAPTGIITTTAMAPRASYAPYYLRGPIKDWTDIATSGREGDARLAGRKRYFPRFPADRVAGAPKTIENTLAKRKSQITNETDSRLRLLEPKAPGGQLCFPGAIRLHNVTAEEIGAVLWTLMFGGDPSKRHMIGRAKNAGAGQAKAVVTKLSLVPNSKSDQKPEHMEIAPFLRDFETYMRDHADRNWPQVDELREFFGISDPVVGAGLKSEFLPEPNDFGRLRRLVKADVQNDPSLVTKADDRLLPAPAVAPTEGQRQ